MDATQSELTSPPASRRELFLFAAVLIALLVIYFSDALRPGWVLSPSDWFGIAGVIGLLGAGYRRGISGAARAAV